MGTDMRTVNKLLSRLTESGDAPNEARFLRPAKPVDPGEELEFDAKLLKAAATKIEMALEQGDRREALLQMAVALGHVSSMARMMKLDAEAAAIGDAAEKLNRARKKPTEENTRQAVFGHHEHDDPHTPGCEHGVYCRSVVHPKESLRCGHKCCETNYDKGATAQSGSTS